MTFDSWFWKFNKITDGSTRKLPCQVTISQNRKNGGLCKQPPKEIYEIVSDNIYLKPKKEFKLFVKKLIKGDFLENYILANSLDNIEDDLVLISYISKSIEDTIIDLYKLSLTSIQLENPDSSMLFNDIPF